MHAPAPSKNPIVPSGAVMDVVVGLVVRPDKTFPNIDCSFCILASKLVEAGRNANIAILSKSEQLSLKSKPGGFNARLKKQPRYMDEEVCNGFSQGTFYCLMKIGDEYNEDLRKTHPTHIDSPRLFQPVITSTLNPGHELPIEWTFAWLWRVQEKLLGSCERGSP